MLWRSCIKSFEYSVVPAKVLRRVTATVTHPRVGEDLGSSVGMLERDGLGYGQPLPIEDQMASTQGTHHGLTVDLGS